ncbi:MFS transporter [Eubacterium sp.]|uniref:MFS transporter n=1 Tax=Eubacterium sp. TaxID=142586 RepID=UPI003F0882C2
MEETKKKETLKTKIVNAVDTFKSHWDKPPQGYQVAYKEFAAFSAGCGSPNLLGVLTQYTTIATSVHLMISYFKMSTGMAWILTILASVIAIIRSPILSMMIDNSNGKNGKFKPFLLWASIGTAVSFSFVPYIPSAWMDIHLFSIPLPAIPIMGVYEESTIDFNLGILLAFILIQIGQFFITLLNQCIAGIEQTISTVAQERANIGSIKGLVSGLPSSVVNIILPILAGTLFAKQGGWNAVNMYRIIFPICGVVGVLMVLLLVKGVEERTVVKQEYVAKVKFLEGMKLLSKSKYFWIITIFNSFNAIRNLANITTWITQYSFVSDTAKTVVGLYCSTILMNAIAVALLVGPFLIKKLGKKNVMIISCVGYVVMIALQVIFHKSPVLILVVSFFEQFFGGFYFVTGIMTSDIMDDIQMKTGKRLEGFWQNYMAIVTTVIGVFTGMLTPLFLSFGGVGFSDDISLALQNTDLRNNIFFYQSLLSLIGAIIVAVPFFFYDLTEKKHANIVRVLRIRAAVDNYNDNMLQADDVTYLKEIVDFANETKEPMLIDELSKYDCINKILEADTVLLT